MAANAGGFEDEPLVAGSYSQLLCGDEISGIQTDGCYDFNSSFSLDDNAKEGNVKVVVELENAKKSGQKSRPACKDSTLHISDKKRNEPGIHKPVSHSGAPTRNQRNSKKPKPDNSTVSGHAKIAKKEKLGDRIAALQQLVSPFGKTDTASVLHEALVYIGFLHDQVHVLCSSYLQRWPTSPEEPLHPDEKSHDLRSRGLCLVPMELGLQVSDSNGSDLWSSVAMVDFDP